MKTYLSLIPISAKIRKRENLMTLLCIIFAVFLVTSIFSLADMGVRMEKNRLIQKHGSETVADLVSNNTMFSLYTIASLLFVLVLVAGILMISSSINSNVNQRTRFFGMMRCIGMSRKQTIRFVRLEALNWCKIAIPIGCILGVITTWVLCGVLKFVVGGEFLDIEIFKISWIGIMSGILMGLTSVLISASSPAKRASNVSPIMAVSGNENITKNINYKINLNFLKVETVLGINNVISKKKNFMLMTLSFALSIILFLSFSVFINFVEHIMPQFSNTADILIFSGDGLNSIDSVLIEKISKIEEVKNVFGRRNIFDIKSSLINSDKNLGDIDVISYDDFDLDSIKKDKLLTKDSKITKVYGNSHYVIAIQDKDGKIKIGDKVRFQNTELEIVGVFKYNIFKNDGTFEEKATIITSDETFYNLFNQKNYSLISIKLGKKANNETIEKIKSIVDDKYILKDIKDQNTKGTYIAFKLFIYGFLIIIAFVTILNIVNSISISVGSRIKQYGIMRAVGMSKVQLTKMILTEAVTYGVSGCIIGSIFGMWINNRLYYLLITKHFSNSIWKFPMFSLIIILLFVTVATILSVFKPIKYINDMSITETIKEL